MRISRGRDQNKFSSGNKGVGVTFSWPLKRSKSKK
jgi:hypothetical protein